MKYHAQTNSFFSSEIADEEGEFVPSDAIEISDDLYAFLMQGQADGYEIIAGPDGMPQLVDPTAMFFGGAEGGFYLRGDAPPGAVEITRTRWQELLNGQSQGQMIVADEDGYPYLALPPEPSLEQRMNNVRHQRDRRLADCDWTQLPDSPALGNAAWLVYRQELRDFPDQVLGLENVDWFNLPWPQSPQTQTS